MSGGLGGLGGTGGTGGRIFIVGAPRSGTTLLRAMLNRHPRIGLCDETFFHYWMVRREKVFGDLADPAARARAIDRFLETRRIRRLGLDLKALRDHLLREATTYPRFFAALLDFYAQAQGKVRGGEKTPQHAFIARHLLEWYPDAFLIHLVRDPRDVVSSLKRMPWGSGSRLDDARLWRACVEGAEACEANPRFLLVRYEDLVAGPEPVLRRLCEFLGEEFVPELLHGEAEADSWRTDRWWFDRAQGDLEKGRIERWREELSPSEVAVVEWVAGDKLAKYGYAPAQPSASAAELARARVAAAVAGVRRRIKHLPASYWRWLHPDQLAREERAIDGPSDPEP